MMFLEKNITFNFYLSEKLIIFELYKSTFSLNKKSDFIVSLTAQINRTPLVLITH